MYDLGLQNWNVFFANVPFTDHKNKYCIVQIIAYTVVHVSSG